MLDSSEEGLKIRERLFEGLGLSPGMVVHFSHLVTYSYFHTEHSTLKTKSLNQTKFFLLAVR